MIYVGDGLTDIPCFSLLKSLNGTAFGVFHPQEESSAKKAFLEISQTTEGRERTCTKVSAR